MMPIGYNFIAPDDWDEWKRVNPDLDQAASWIDFREHVEKFHQDLLAKGGRPVKLDVRPSEFVAWCLANKRDVGPRARADYAMARTIELARDGKI